MRIVALYIFVILLSIYAWKNWYLSLCGLILMMCTIEHEDMPKSMFGLHGMNMWNVLFAAIVLAWAFTRGREGLRWDMPRHVAVLLLMYMGVIAVGVLRLILDQSHLAVEEYPYGTKGFIAEEWVNTVKWILPGLLLYDGCRSSRRVVMALVCIIAMYFLISVQVVRRLPLGSILQSDSNLDQTRQRCARIGYSASDMSVMLAGVSWAILAALPLVRKKYRVVLLALAGTVVIGQALTGGRGGYVAFGATGLVLCLMKWRKYLILMPILVILLAAVFPGAAERMLSGFGATDVSGQATVDEEALTAGRNIAWPYVVDKICESPLVGYGRLAMKRTGLYDRIEVEYPGTGAPHPHNMYLETLLDNGIVGSAPILLFWAFVVIYSARLFRSSDHLCSATGGLSLALVLSSLFAGLTGQHVYPMEHTMCMWTAAFLMFRVHVEEARTQNTEFNSSYSLNSLAFIQS